MRKASVLLGAIGALFIVVSFLPWSAAGPWAGAKPTLAAQGAALFQAKGCVGCHSHAAVAGTSAGIGPNLTHYEGDASFLRRWLADPAAVRPNTRMPNLELEPAEIEALIAFLLEEPS